MRLSPIAKDLTSTSTLPKNVKSVLDSFEKTAANDAAQLQKSVEDWYNSAMDRVSGWYKRRAQIFIFVLGCAIAVLVNADCVQYAQRLSKDSSLRQSVVALAEATAKKDPTKNDKIEPVDKIKTQIKALDGIGPPIGWGEHHYEHSAEGGLKAAQDHAIGWFLTALAISFGAPFWFDTLNKLIVVRSTVKPHEKSREDCSKDPTKKLDATKAQGTAGE